MVIAGLLGWLWLWKEFQFDGAATEYLNALAIRDSLITVNTRLKSELSVYADFARIERLARERLGMQGADQSPEELVIKGQVIPQEIGTASLIPRRRM